MGKYSRVGGKHAIIYEDGILCNTQCETFNHGTYVYIHLI